VTDWADADGVQIYHEVFSDENFKLFMKWGFKCERTITVAEDDNSKVVCLIFVRPKTKRDLVKSSFLSFKSFKTFKSDDSKSLKSDDSTGSESEQSGNSNESGTMVAFSEKHVKLFDVIQDVPKQVDTWERNILALEKGEWSDDMDNAAFRKYAKNRSKIRDSVFNVEKAHEQKSLSSKKEPPNLEDEARIKELKQMISKQYRRDENQEEPKKDSPDIAPAPVKTVQIVQKEVNETVLKRVQELKEAELKKVQELKEAELKRVQELKEAELKRVQQLKEMLSKQFKRN